MKNTKLARSRSNRLLAGVAGGIAEHYGLNVWGVRLLLILLNPTIVIYILLWITLPLEPEK